MPSLLADASECEGSPDNKRSSCAEPSQRRSRVAGAHAEEATACPANTPIRTSRQQACAPGNASLLVAVCTAEGLA